MGFLSPKEKAAGAPISVEVDQRFAESIFTSATEVAATDRYVVFDFGMMPLVGDEALTAPTTSVRIYMNYYTAKRLHIALLMSMERHIETFGPVGQNQMAKMQTPPDVALRPGYVNFVRLTGTPEELIIDTGLNPQPVGVPAQPISANYTLTMDFQTANSLLHQLSRVLEQYESTHGPIETDIQKRIVK